MHPLLPVLALTLGLTACSDGPESDPSEPTSPTPDTPSDTGRDTGTAPILTVATVSVTTQPGLPWLGFDIELENGPSARLACDSDTEPDERHARDVTTGFTELAGLLSEHPYSCRVFVERDGEEHVLWSSRIPTGPLPEGLPAPTVTQVGDAEAEGGWLVFNVWGGGGPHRALVVDGQGRIRWHRELDAGSGGVSVHWDGESIVAGGRGLPPSRFGLDGSELYRGPELIEDDVFYHHEARPVTVEGTPAILALSSTLLPADVRTEEPVQKGFLVEAHDPTTGEILWSYDVMDHLDGWGPPRVDDDPWHINAVTWEPDGHSWFSARGTNQLTRVDRSTGQITHVLGEGGTVELIGADGQPSTAWFEGQHGPTQQGDRLYLLDNGRPRRGGSRAVAYELDLASDRATEVWSWSEPGWIEPYYGNVLPLPAGHVLIASGHCSRCDDSGGQSRTAFIAEVDPATQEVRWRLELPNPSTSLFRAQFVPGCDMFHHVGRCEE